MAEQEELRLTVTFVDNATAGLEKLKESLKEIGGEHGGGSKHVEKFNEQTKAVTEVVKKMTGEIGEAFKNLGMLRLGFAGGAAGLALFGFEMTKQIAAVVEFADKIRALNQQARQFGINPAQLKNVTEQLEAFGISGDQAVASIGAVSAKIADLQRVGSQLRLDLMRQAGHDPQAIKNMENYLNRLTHARDITEQLNIIREGGEQVYNNARKQGYGEQEAANRRNSFWQKQGYDARLAEAGVLAKMTDEEKRIADMRAKNAEDLANQMGKIERKWNDIIELSKQPLLENLKTVLAYIDPILDKLNSVMEYMDKVDSSKLGSVKEGIQPLPPGQGVQGSWLRGFGDWWIKGQEDQKKTEQENTDATKKLTDELNRANQSYVPMSYTGAGGGRGLLQNASLTTGSYATTTAGGAPYGNDTGPGTGKGAGSTPPAGAGPPATGAPSGGGNTRGDRNNNPGNMKFGPLAKAFGATGADNRGFAIFPDRLSGASAQEALIKSNAYSGLTLSQFANKYAEGSKDWAGTVGKELGIGPNDIVPNQDPRLAGAIQKAEGTTGGGGGGPAPGVAGVPHPYERRRGEPGEFNYAATGALGRPGTNLTTITLKNGQKATVNAAGAENFRSFANEMIDKGYPVDLRGGGGFAMRGKAGGGGLSMHAYGSALDINVAKNPFHGRTTDLPPDVEEMAWKHGLSWGGRFGDPMHFEIMSPEAAANKRKILEARGVIDKSQATATKVEGTGKLTVDVNAPKGTNVGAEGGGLFKNVEVNRQTQMSPARRGPQGGYATEALL